MIFNVTVKQHLPLHQGHRFTILCALLGIEQKIQHNRILSDVLFQA